MKIKEPSTLKDKLTKRILRYTYILLDNTDDSKPERNGEAVFMDSIRTYYLGKKFTLFDIGANLGEYTETIRKGNYAEATYHLFEPQRSCVDLLTQKFQGDNNVIINNVGLSDTTATATLYTDSQRSPLGSLYKRDLESHNLAMDVVEEITLTTGNEYVRQHQIETINLMKIDVEGHELSVFNGFGDFLDAKNIDFIQFEYGGANIDSGTTLRQIHTLLSSKGFVLCKLMRGHLEPRPFHPYLENFRYQNWVAVSKKVFETITHGSSK